jgi:methionyl-tRNA formyltransferase
MAGDAETGVMVMRMEEGLDTGPVALTDRVAIGPDVTAGELHDALAPRGAALMARALDALAAGSLAFTPQTETGVCYAHKIEKAEARLDWTLPASVLHNRIRGLSPFPGAYFEADLGRDPERVKVLRATVAAGAGAPGQVLDENLTVACGAGALRLLEVQRAGKPALDAATFLRGTRIAAGQSLASI